MHNISMLRRGYNALKPVFLIYLWYVGQEVGGNCIMTSFINSYTSPSIIRMIKSRRMRWAGHVARMGENRNAYRILVGKPEGKRPRRRWADNIKINLAERGGDGMDWVDVAQNREQWRALVNTVLNLRIP
jgi:hypothetical protein